MSANPFDIITFDCYGTLVDWESGISESFAAEAARDGVHLKRDEILREHARIEPVVQAESFRSYHDVLIETAVRMAEALGWRLDRSRARFLPEGLVHWKALPDTNAALVRLRSAGYRMGILSNVDDRLLEGTRERLDADFELIVTAEQVRSYKPARGHFDEARRQVGSDRWLHAAQSWFHDIVPAEAHGIPSVWVNRKHETPTGEARPIRIVDDMAGLAAWLVDGTD